MKHYFLIKSFFIVALFAMLLYSCSNEEGFGGSSSIEGVLMQRFYNNDFTVFQHERPAVDEDVFIIFGDDKSVGDDTETSMSGNFKFDFLWPGKYKLYYFSDDTSKTELDDVVFSRSFELGKGESYVFDTLYTYKALDWDDGHAKIKGKVMVWNYKNSSSYPNLEVKDYTPAQEQEVFITYNHEDYYSDRIRTQDDGTFVFPNLLKGHYRIFVYSEDVYTGGTADIPVTVEVEITGTNQVIVLDDIDIETH